MDKDKDLNAFEHNIVILIEVKIQKATRELVPVYLHTNTNTNTNTILIEVKIKKAKRELVPECLHHLDPQLLLTCV